jgi:hypothetical protein
LCREHGQQLAAAKRDTNQLEGFNLFGVIKETGVVSRSHVVYDDQWLAFFYPH